MTAGADTGAGVATGADELLGLYEQMAVIRGTEKAAHDLFLAGLVKGTWPRGTRPSPSAPARRCGRATMCSPPTAATTMRWPAAHRPRNAWPS